MIDEGRPYKVVEREKHRIERIVVVKDTILLNGNKHPFTYVEYKDSICVLAIYRGSVVAIEQYRHTLNSWELELPCGGVEPGESDEHAAARELLEETGFVAGEMNYLGKYYTNQGYSSCACGVYFTRCDDYLKPEREETELIQTKLIPIDEFDEKVKGGEFRLLIGIAAWDRAKALGLV